SGREKILIGETEVFQPAALKEVEVSIWQIRMHKRRSCIYQIAILSLTGAQLLLRALALSDVNHGTHVFDEITCRAENRMTSAVNVPDGATRMHESVVRFELCLFWDYPLHQFFQLGLVIGM